jgi:formylglycine-generating enzyme required for sulfatase activity
MAMAFCIWDDARLPSEAEWAYAAFGGTRERAYPWQEDIEPQIDHQHAQYCDKAGTCDGPSHVGEHGQGRSALNHDDLAGNVEEWVADKYQVRLPSSCSGDSDSDERAFECLQLEGTDTRVTRGGSYRDAGDRLRNVRRSSEVAVRARSWIGFRCARDL